MRVGVYLTWCVVLLAVGMSVVTSPQGVAATSPTSEIVPAAAPDSYRLSAGDTLSIVVVGEDVFTRECQINGAGTISYPKLGDVRVVGLTCEELRTRLDHELRTYLKNPQVMVTIRQYGQTGMSVFVMGEVKNPGPYPLANGTGFMQALAAAGGLNETASGEINVMKGRTGQTVTFLLNEAGAPSVAGLTLDPGDVLLVLRKREARYAVLGEVAKPGMFSLPVRGEVRMLDAIQQAGLLSVPDTSPAGSSERKANYLDDPGRTADLEHARLTRAGKDLPINIVALLRGDTTQNYSLQDGDVITVPRRATIQVYATGEVRSPGIKALAEGATVMDLLTAADGLTTSARPSRSKLVRSKGPGHTMGELEKNALSINISDLMSGDMKQNIVLQDGDVLVVPPERDSGGTLRTVLSSLSLLLRIPW